VLNDDYKWKNMTEQIEHSDKVNLTIDGVAVSVPKGTTVFKAASDLGIKVPVFCYQDRMPPFGACRVCLVEVEKMPKLQTSCTLVATEGMVVKTQSQNAIAGRDGILEFLLINHPLDCPVCDRGGECPLQEHAYNFGPGKSRFYEEKRHFEKPVPRGPVLMLDRERCIICARCTRFGELIAGDHALELMERGYRTEVGTPDGGPAESKFIGNTIMICPVGALTSQVYRFRARPWDNDSTPSTCTLCPVGCSLVLDSRDGEIMRTRSHENRNVNDIWLCDKGWFGYEFSSHPDRLQTPLIRSEGKLVPATWDQALTLVAEKIQAFKSNGKIGALGGDPLTVEENYLFQKLMREGAGVNNIDHRVGTPIVELNNEGLVSGMKMTIGECEQLSYVVLLGIDLTEEFPVIWLRIKQAINCGAKVLFLGHYLPEIAEHLTQTILHSPGKELETLKDHFPEMKKLAENGKKGAFFVGRQYLNNSQRMAILSELKKHQQETPNLTLNILEGHGNSFGSRLAGMRPDLKPFGELESKPGLNAIQMVEQAAKSGWSLLYVAGANPALKFPSKLWNEARAKLGFLVVQDLFLTETASQADVVFPALSFVEKGGSFINIEGRVQRLLPGKEVPESILSDGEIFTNIAQKLNLNLSIDEKFADLLKQEIIEDKSNVELKNIPVQNEKLPEGSLAATFTPALFDHGVRMKHNPHVIKLAKEPKVRLHQSEGMKRGIKDGDQIKLSANGNTITAKVALDKDIALNTIVIPTGFEDMIPIHDLGTNLQNGMSIQISK
jgi:NADH-quinone oxidoreductase subunit G